MCTGFFDFYFDIRRFPPVQSVSVFNNRKAHTLVCVLSDIEEIDIK